MNGGAAGEIIGYGIVVRRPAFGEEMLPAGIPGQGGDRPMIFATESEAKNLADKLQDEHAKDRYRFVVAVCRSTPQWYVLNPRNDRERVHPVGSRECNCN